MLLGMDSGRRGAGVCSQMVRVEETGKLAASFKRVSVCVCGRGVGGVNKCHFVVYWFEHS